MSTRKILNSKSCEQGSQESQGNELKQIVNNKYLSLNLKGNIRGINRKINDIIVIENKYVNLIIQTARPRPQNAIYL